MPIYLYLHLKYIVLTSTLLLTVEYDRALGAARMKAATDDHALERLNQLIKLRALVAPWLEQPVSLQVVFRAVTDQLKGPDGRDRDAAEQDHAAMGLIHLIENVSKSWQHTLMFFDGSNDRCRLLLFHIKFTNN